MKTIAKIFGLLLLGVATLSIANEKAALDTQTRMQLQSALRMHISHTSVEGAYPHMDLKSGTINKLYPASSHPMVLSLGNKYVMCSEFRDTDGKQVSADFYVTKKGENFTIFQVELNNRAPLERLVKNGIAKMIGD